MKDDSDSDDAGESPAATPEMDSYATALLASQHADLTRLMAIGTEMAERLDRMNPALAAKMRKEVALCRRQRDRLPFFRSPSSRRPPKPGTAIH